MKFQDPLFHRILAVAVDSRPQEFRKDQDKLLIIKVDGIGIKRKRWRRSAVSGEIPVSDIQERKRL